MAGSAAATHIGTITLLKQDVKAFRLRYTSRVSNRRTERGNVEQNEFACLLHSQPRPEKELRRNHQRGKKQMHKKMSDFHHKTKNTTEAMQRRQNSAPQPTNLKRVQMRAIGVFANEFVPAILASVTRRNTSAARARVDDLDEGQRASQAAEYEGMNDEEQHL